MARWSSDSWESSPRKWRPCPRPLPRQLRVSTCFNGTIWGQDRCSASEVSDFGFVRTGIEELLRSRRALSSSYAYGYFLPDSGYNKTIFEYLQVPILPSYDEM